MMVSTGVLWWATLICFVGGYLLGFLRARYLFRPRPKLLTGKVTPPAPSMDPPTWTDIINAAAVLIPVVVEVMREPDPKPKPAEPKVERDVTPEDQSGSEETFRGSLPSPPAPEAWK